MYSSPACRVVLSAVLIAAAGVSLASNAYAAKRPNVVLIMTDNHGAWTLGCYGNKDIRTPNIDKLAEEGTLFDNAFASNPVCSPTRATTLTGLIPSQHGVHCFLRGGRLQTGPDARNTLEEFTSLPEVLKREGYRCGLVGKWHLGANASPQEGMDDYWITMPHGGTSTFYDAKIIEDGKQRTEPEYLTDFWTKHAVKFIDNNDDKPFFLFLAYNGPYSLSRLLLREGQNRHAEFYRGKDLPSFPREKPHPWQLHNRDFQNNPVSIQRVATEVSGVDDGVGQVMAALKANGLDDNTIVVFMADQGWVGGHGGFFGMGDHTRPITAVDGMMKIPMIWRHSGNVAAGKRSQKLVANYDIYSSLLEHLGIVANKLLDEPVSPGASFVNELRVDAPVSAVRVDDADDAVFYEFEGLRCVRTAEWKYTHRHPNGPHELYDLKNDPQEFNNLYRNDPAAIQQQLHDRLSTFFTKHASPKYDLYNGGGSQTVIYDGEEEEIAQAEPTPPPALPDGFVTKQFTLPDGFSSQLIAGPPLVNHPTMGCFDDIGRLFVCDGAGVNMSAEELEKNLPNEIRMLEDQDGDGVFDKSTVFADKMTFPMGGTWHDGALYVASPPNIWRLEDTTGDGKADKRDILVDSFGYTGNAASIHGCFKHPSGRIYWCDGYHGHEFKDEDGKVTSKRKGSYIFSCWPDGRDVRIHCGGGMDNPVEVDFTDEGDIIGTVNIMYTRPRIDCLVHWQYGGAYPHREAVLEELKVTGDLLGPIHKFGHVAISGTTRYRSGVMNHNWGDNFFATEFNLGKVVRVELERSGSTYACTEREFLSCKNRDFHPTDVMEDADGSLLVVDTGGWFYRGCPTSQIAKPDVKGGIYRIVRDGMTTVPDPRGNRIEWAGRNASKLMQDLKDTCYALREKAIQECVRRGDKVVPSLASTVKNGDILARQNAIWALTRMLGAVRTNDFVPPISKRSESATLDNKLQSPTVAVADVEQAPRVSPYTLSGRSIYIARATLVTALEDRDAGIRQTAWTATGTLASSLDWEDNYSTRQGYPNGSIKITNAKGGLALRAAGVATGDLGAEKSPQVRRSAYAAMGKIGVLPLRRRRHVNLVTGEILFSKFPPPADRAEEHALLYALVENRGVAELLLAMHNHPDRVSGNFIIAADQASSDGLSLGVLEAILKSNRPNLHIAAARLLSARARNTSETNEAMRDVAIESLDSILSLPEFSEPLGQLVAAFGADAEFAAALASRFERNGTTNDQKGKLLDAIAQSPSPLATAPIAALVRQLLNSTSEDIRLKAIRAAGAVGGALLVDTLDGMATDETRSSLERLAAIESLARSDRKLPAARLELLQRWIQNGTAVQRSDASRVLTAYSVTAEQLQQIAPLLADAGPQQLNDLVSLFSRRLSPELAVTFLDNIENARSLNSLPALTVSEIVKRFPEKLHDRANALLDKMQAAEQQKLLKLDVVVGMLKAGNPAAGREVFFSEKAKCATCHVVGTKDNGELIGKRVGPDLTTIGASRAPKDLLESILFPSSTIVRQYEPYTLVTTEGRSYSGLVIKDTADEITIQQSTRDPVTVARRDIEELVPSTVSIMPKGLDETLTPQQIADMVAWLQTLR